MMPDRPFTHGLHDLGAGCYAWVQPDGSWGWSNAGLVVDSGAALLIDTLFDLKLTRAMLERMRAAVPAAARIGTLVNTHGNPDHYFGNELVGGAAIVATEEAAAEMRETTPELLAGMMRNWRMMGEAGAFLHEVMGVFEFDGITLTPPTQTFRGEITLPVGTKQVQVIEVGPAHTRGDAIVHVPAHRAVFTGDILFHGGHPIVWAGPVGNWVRACETILGLDVDVVVPGHGPVTDKGAVLKMRDYFEWLLRETRPRYDAGMDFAAAARDIPLGPYAGWIDAERMVANCRACYAEFAGDARPPDVAALFAAMARYRKERTR
jgi:glyoxylase-like metal-dependent hydrolase (beta-lactamase superfamily II)